jgi:hypothetical protein
MFVVKMYQEQDIDAFNMMIVELLMTEGSKGLHM